MKKILARFASKCSETGKKINKYDLMYYDYGTKKCFSIQSKRAEEFEREEKERAEADSVNSYLDAQEQAYYLNQYSY